MSALVAATYRSTVGDSLDAASLAALAANPAIRTLFGEPVALDDPGGFTVWRTGTVVAVLVGVWALLAATRMTRGEEDAGRWDLLLAGRLPIAAVRRPPPGRAGVVAVPPGSRCRRAVGRRARTGRCGAARCRVALVGVFFVAVGGLAAQVFPTRSAASGAAVAVLGVGLLARMVGDGVAALAWLRWLTPFGLAALTRPYAANWSLPLRCSPVPRSARRRAPIAASRRDLRGGCFARGRSGAPDGAARFGAGVRGAPAAAAARGVVGRDRRVLPADRVDRGVDDRVPRRQPALRRPGRPGRLRRSRVRCTGYAGTLFALLAVPVGVFTAVRIATFAADESGRAVDPAVRRAA